MFETFDKIKKQAMNAGNNIMNSFKSKGIQPCDGADYEYSSNDEDYNEFLENLGAERPDYVNIEKEEPPKEKVNKEKVNIKKTVDNIGGTILDKIGNIKTSLEENRSKPNKAEMAKIQENFDGITEDLKKISEEIDNISDTVSETKDDVTEIRKTSKNLSAEFSFTVEKLAKDLNNISSIVAVTKNEVSEITEKIIGEASDIDKLKSDYESLKKNLDILSADVAEISANQQMAKNSLLAMAESFDALNKKIAIGFVTIGVLSALGVVVQIVFNFI